MTKKIERKELVAAIEALNKSEGLLEKKIKTNKVKTEELTENFKTTMLALSDQDRDEEIPDLAFDFYEKYLGADAGKEEKKEKAEKVKAEAKAAKAKKATEPKKPRKSGGKKDKVERDKYGFGVGTRCNMIMDLAETGKYTLKQIVEKLEGQSKINPSSVFRLLPEKGFEVTFTKDKVIKIKKK